MNTTPQNTALSKKALTLAILIELRKHTELLTNLCRHQDDEIKRQDRFGGVALPSALRTAAPMPGKPVPPAPEYDPVTGCVFVRKPEEAVKAQTHTREPVASADTLALIVAELCGLRADLAGLDGAQPMRTLSTIAEQASEVGQRAMLPTDFKVSTNVRKAVGVRPVTSFSVVRLLDSQPVPGLPALSVSLEAELTPSEQRVLADLLLSVARRTQPDFDRPAS